MGWRWDGGKWKKRRGRGGLESKVEIFMGLEGPLHLTCKGLYFFWKPKDQRIVAPHGSGRGYLIPSFSLIWPSECIVLITSSMKTMAPQLEQMTALCLNVALVTLTSFISNVVFPHLGHDGVAIGLFLSVNLVFC